jgi:hypothetical protein
MLPCAHPPDWVIIDGQQQLTNTDPVHMPLCVFILTSNSGCQSLEPAFWLPAGTSRDAHCKHLAHTHHTHHHHGRNPAVRHCALQALTNTQPTYSLSIKPSHQPLTACLPLPNARLPCCCCRCWNRHVHHRVGVNGSAAVGLPALGNSRTPPGGRCYRCVLQRVLLRSVSAEDCDA